MFKILIKFGVFLSLALVNIPILAAKPINLGMHDVSILNLFSAQTVGLKNTEANQIKQVSQAQDLNQTNHIRIKQTYAGYPVMGGDGVIHVPASAKKTSLAQTLQMPNKAITMNGTLYQDLNQDLQATPTEAQSKGALAKAIDYYKAQVDATPDISSQQSKLKVFVDNDNKAHWVFHIRFSANFPDKRPAMPNFIMDADNFKIYKQWDDVKTLNSLDKVSGGGVGGNVKIGKIFYDGKLESSHLAALNIKRDPTQNTCYLSNDDVMVVDYRKGINKIVAFDCSKPHAENPHLYWNSLDDSINGGYSPNNDALYAGQVIAGLYRDWYQLHAIKDDFDRPLTLTMVTHLTFTDNAFWHPELKRMYYGDGYQYFYPLTSIGVGAHEISHGFTDQPTHSGLEYEGESGGMNEAFSDMAAQAAEFYTFGKNTWQIGTEITKTKQLPVLRFLDKPDEDCKFTSKPEPGKNCSLQSYKAYTDYVTTHKNDYKLKMDNEGNPILDEYGNPIYLEDYRLPNVHYSSGIYNHAFYILANEKNWNVRKAFDVMVQANRFYWTEKSTFAQGGCGVVSAAQDYGYDLNGVYKAFDMIGIDVKTCVLKLK